MLMKRGQLLSQPLYYIFAIVVIGLILIFGFRYVGKLLKTGCEVEVLDFVSEVRNKVNQLASLSYGSSFECSIVRISGQSESSCELALPSDVKGICFIDTTKDYNVNAIPFRDTKQLVADLGRNANRNLFYSVDSGGSCEAVPANIKKLTTDGVVCVNAGARNSSFIMENIGNEIIIRKA